MKKRINIWIDAEIHKQAKDLGLNVSRVCERALGVNVGLLLQKNMGPAYEQPNIEEDTQKLTTSSISPSTEPPALSTVQATEKEEDEEKDAEPNQWVCPSTGKMGNFERCQRRSKQNPESCNNKCKKLTKYYRGIVFGEEEEAEEDIFDPEDVKEVEKLAKEGLLSFEEIAEKIDMDERDLKELVKYHGITIEEPKKEPVTPQATQKPIVVNEHKETETQKEEPAIPEKPSTAIIPPKPEEPSVDQPGMKAPETVGDPDPVVQQAAYIRTLREKSEKKPKTRGQQTFGPEKGSSA